jgi:hypothetical protein
MGSLPDLIRDLKTYEAKKQVLQELKKQVKQPLPGVQRAVKARALATLPSGGGLNAWVAKARVGLAFKLRSATSAQIQLKASRKSFKNKSDLNRIDKGRVRAPSWGYRTRASWHSQTVTPGFFSKPAADSVDEFKAVAEKAIDNATEVIRRG